MRIALISDIHSNLEALIAVEQRLSDILPDVIYCLGDVIGYGSDPIPVTQRVRDLCRVTLAGNHDLAFAQRLSRFNFNDLALRSLDYTQEQFRFHPLLKRFITHLPLSHQEQPLFFVHAAYPDDTQTYVYRGQALGGRAFGKDSFTYITELFEKMPSGTRCFYGHTHFPEMYTQLPGEARTYLPLSFTAGDFVSEERILPPTAKLIINVGSVGQPRDYDPRACFAVYDTKKDSITWHRVAYDLETTQRKIRAAGLPEQLAERLHYGK